MEQQSTGTDPSDGEERSPLQKRVVGVLHIFGCCIALLPMAAGILVLGYQILVWLKEGYWHPYPVGAVIYRVLPVDFWYEFCGSWVGLQKIVFAVLEGVPLSLALVVAGAAFLAADS